MQSTSSPMLHPSIVSRCEGIFYPSFHVIDTAALLRTSHSRHRSRGARSTIRSSGPSRKPLRERSGRDHLVMPTGALYPDEIAGLEVGDTAGVERDHPIFVLPGTICRLVKPEPMRDVHAPISAAV